MSVLSEAPEGRPGFPRDGGCGAIREVSERSEVRVGRRVLGRIEERMMGAPPVKGLGGGQLAREGYPHLGPQGVVLAKVISRSGPRFHDGLVVRRGGKIGLDGGEFRCVNL